jgi:DNA helicase-2/ATP-dependent DNA helicase PcrA
VRSVEILRGHLDDARRAFSSGAALSTTASELFEKVGLKSDLLEAQGGTIGARKWQNGVFLLNGIERYEKTAIGEKPSLATFLQRITMRFDQDTEEEAGNRVTLSTLHASKGLEFPVVFLIGCVEGQLPHSRTTDPKITEASPTDVEEERRLFYVGVTRAKDRLYLSRPRSRPMRGKVQPLTPSRFLDGLPEDALLDYERPDEKPLETQDAADFAKSILDQLRGG